MLRLLALLCLAPVVFAQSTDAVLTQTLVNEIRALRQELQATNVTSQRVQIALFRLQSQTAIVNTAQQRLDATRAQLAEAEANHRRAASQFQSMEEINRNGQATEQQKKEFQEEQPRFKGVLETMAAEETARRTTMVDAESQLRNEQAKLADLQSLLDRLDRALDELARAKQ
jgi:ABC-type sugar transport system ATPase subunit